MAIFTKKTADHGDVVIAFFEDVAAGDEAGAPLIEIVAVCATVGVDVFLRNSEDDGADFGPHAGTGAHGAGFVGGIEDEFGEIAAVAAGNVFERFEFDVLYAGAGSFDAIAGIGDDDFALAG